MSGCILAQRTILLALSKGEVVDYYSFHDLIGHPAIGALEFEQRLILQIVEFGNLLVQLLAPGSLFPGQSKFQIEPFFNW